MPTKKLFAARARAAAAFVLIAALGGCGEPEAGRVDADRSPERAEEALRTALDAWKTGGKPGALLAQTPSIAVHDAVWKSGRTLADYTIRSRTEGDVRVDFVVALTLAKPDAQVDQTYYVWGKTPLSVYRREDFERILATDRP